MGETLQSMVWRKPSFDASAPSKPPGPPLPERVRLAKLFCTMKLALRQPRQRMRRLDVVRNSARTPPDALQSQRPRCTARPGATAGRSEICAGPRKLFICELVTAAHGLVRITGSGTAAANRCRRRRRLPFAGRSLGALRREDSLPAQRGVHHSLCVRWATRPGPVSLPPRDAVPSTSPSTLRCILTTGD